jgi:hypothetical protein
MDKVATKEIKRKKRKEENDKWTKTVVDLKTVIDRVISIIAQLCVKRQFTIV